MDYIKFELLTASELFDPKPSFARSSGLLQGRQVSARVCWLRHGADYRWRGF